MRGGALAVVALVLGWGAAGCGAKAPSPKQCRETWQKAPSGEKVLECTFQDGERATNELGGQRSLKPVGTCWDYDVVVAQRCGCRRFARASICCRTGSTSDCEWRIGNSTRVDCGRYGQPAFGLSGKEEPADCKAARMQAECYARKDLLFAGAVVGPCRDGGLRFTCPGGQETQSRFLNGQCGPTPEACGCRLVEECSQPGDVACYRRWSGDPEAVACFADNPAGYAQTRCHEGLMAARGTR